ncbi:MAG TPA: DUF3267 domain-containing protein [Bacteroidales bacterium]|nr:DUF3267 domain-containing protein [Bacteroidales bacterium]
MEQPGNYKKEKLTIDIGKANLYSLLVFIPVGLFFVLPFIVIWHESASWNTITEFFQSNNLSVYWGLPLTVLLVLFLGIAAHELLHGLAWSRFATKGFRSVKFGVIWKMVTPYCHCTEPLTVKHYIIGAIVPAIVLGIIPSIVGIITGSLALLVFGAFFTIASTGDFMVIDLLRKEKMSDLVQDHPSEAGCYIYRLNKNS